MAEASRVGRAALREADGRYGWKLGDIFRENKLLFEKEVKKGRKKV